MNEMNTYNILNQIGEGMSSRIFKAIERSNNRHVALKVEKTKNTLKIEYSILKSLNGISFLN